MSGRLHFECGRPLSAYLGALVTVLLVAVVLLTVLRSLGASLPVPFKSELF